ncbi:Ldh family oxidoreductase [Phyllobacterium leguminum]|uniref:LDH2 family malate/lactate/ureidoglycolate dehydrogenase n=1 Tax=Phyllobacterium leguminum TaxID=314237 RepID=A0A318STS2_9HYPH|nr:Ldh family oxidoreductase [Phyllobacterium leguminum]PYE85260.1 LDH2 family malate/lactate/ureidoglycolate dehydrogenase [Phyllobacterium leguminum]
MTETTFFPIAELFELVKEIFVSAGCSDGQAAAISRVIVAGERDGCKSHGIYRIEGCLRTIRAGKVVPDAVPTLGVDDSAIVRVDAKGGFSNAAFELGLPALAARTRALGLAAMVINNCTHFSALWPEVEAIAEEGLAGLAMCPSYATVAPAGGRTPLLGTNPMAFGWPRENNHPYVFDFATSVAARGEIELHRRAGKALPEGWALDANGEPTTSPEQALAGAMLPFGGHKGSAISTMIELLAGAMIGDAMSQEALDVLGTTSLAPNHGELILAFDPQKFSGGRKGNPLAHAEILFEGIMGHGARLPSQRRFAARAKSIADGIELSAAEMAQLRELRQ